MVDSEFKFEPGEEVRDAFYDERYLIKNRHLDDNGVPVYRAIAIHDGSYMLFREYELKETE